MPQSLLVFSFMEESIFREPYSDSFSNVTVCIFCMYHTLLGNNNCIISAKKVIKE